LEEDSSLLIVGVTLSVVVVILVGLSVTLGIGLLKKYVYQHGGTFVAIFLIMPLRREVRPEMLIIFPE
jgi:hypothetical protein